MTEQGWLSSDDPAEMLRFLLPHHKRDRVGGQLPASQFEFGDRKLRLWVEACRGVWGGQGAYDLGLQLRDAVAVWSQPQLPRQMPDATTRAHLLRDVFGNPFRPATFGWRVVRGAHSMSAAALESGASEEQVWFGDWMLTPTVLQLAKAIDADRAYDRMPVLATALEEAGCNDEGVLRHCLGFERCWAPGCQEGMGPDWCPTWRELRGPHCTGCHVIDCILGRD